MIIKIFYIYLIIARKNTLQCRLLIGQHNFAPFAALTGHQEAINETKRLTEPKRLLDEHQQEILNRKLQYLLDNIQTQPKVEMIYFKQDVKKDGGSYEKKVAQLKKIDEYEKKLILIDGSVVFIRDIYSIVL